MLRIRKTGRILTNFILVFTLVFTLLLAQPAFAEDTAAGTGTGTAGSTIDADYIKSMIDLIKEQYKGDVTDKQLLEGILKGLFGSMDPYTVFLNQEESKSLLGDIGGTYEGIGVMIERVGDYTVVSKVFLSSPAEKAGIIAGDKIVSVDGKSVIGTAVDLVASYIKGKPGTKVKVGIVRNGKTGIMELTISRAQIKVNPVTYRIDKDIAYVKLDLFNGNLNENLTNALKEIDSKNIKKLILDLRDNPGGDVDQAVAAARKFVPKGLITKLDFKAEDKKDVEYYSNLEVLKYKLAVLVNKNSASASEILAGAIQDTGAGTLIGSKTFGKAKVQSLLPLLSEEAFKKYQEKYNAKVVNVYELMTKFSIIPLENEIIGYTKITTGLYTTPKGRMLDGVGLTPDIAVNDYTLIKDIDVNSIQKLTKTTKPKLNNEGIDVLNAEKILKLAGYDIDTPDMKLDAKTFKAIDSFRKDNGLSAGGTLDFTTQQKLNERLDTLILLIDRQYAKAIEVLNKN